MNTTGEISVEAIKTFFGITDNAVLEKELIALSKEELSELAAMCVQQVSTHSV